MEQSSAIPAAPGRGMHDPSAAPPTEAEGESSVQDDELERTSKFWEKQFEVQRTAASYWLNNDVIVEHVYGLMTGSCYYWLAWLFESYFASDRFERLLSVGCGDGISELQMIQSGKVGFLQGFDISEGALQTAVERFEQAGIPKDRYRFEVGDANDMAIPGTFDLVMAISSIHHVENLEDLLDKVVALLGPRGRFVLLEYVGASRFQHTDDQVSIINDLIRALDPRYLHGGVRTAFRRPTVEDMIRVDPSEAVRSGEIVDLVRDRFEVEYERNYNGTLLAWLHPLLDSELVGKGRADFDSIIRLIAYFEDLLIRKGVIGSDFVLMVCRAKTPGRDPRGASPGCRRQGGVAGPTGRMTVGEGSR